MPWGHRSIARAIFSYLKEHERDGDSTYKVDYVEVKAELGIFNDIYAFIYKFAPVVNRVTHSVSHRKEILEKAEELAMLSLSGIRGAVSWYKPDLIISAYHFHSHCLAKLRKDEKLKFHLWTVVADPWTPSPFSFLESADLHLVYDETGLGDAIRFGIDRKKVLVTGWWVRPELYNSKIKDQKSNIKRKLGFIDERPVIFIGGGSLGTSSLTKILPVLPFVKEKVGLIINTGEDKLMFNLVEEYVKLLRRLKRDNQIIIKNFGWIDNMAEVLSASDIVFGKAGPNFLFDVVAMEKPFVAITHIGGQEDGNIELIKKKKLGWIKEKNEELISFFREYIKRPKSYNNKFKETIAVEAEKNKGSLEEVRKRVISE